MRNHLRDLLLAKIAASPGRDFGEKRAHADISKSEILVYNVLRFEIAGDRTLAAGAVLTITFAILVSITLVVPSFPPAPLLYEYVRIQQTTLSLWGISIATLFDGIINGLFWTIFIAVTYGLAQIAIPTRELGPLPPMPLDPRLAAPLPDNTLVVSKGSIIPPALTLTIRKNPARSPTRTKSAPSMTPKTRIQLKM